MPVKDKTYVLNSKKEETNLEKHLRIYTDVTKLSSVVWENYGPVKENAKAIIKKYGTTTVDGVKYSLVKEKIFDVAQFKKAHPEVYSKYSGEYLKEKEILKKITNFDVAKFRKKYPRIYAKYHPKYLKEEEDLKSTRLLEEK